MSKNIYKLILKVGVYMSLFSVFLVYSGFLFPYITSKQIYFNILIEFISIFWVVYLLKYPKERPKITYVGWGLIAYFSVVLLTSFTGVDFNLSFWGDIERMLGFFHIVHFLVLYFIIITVMREWQDWKIFLLLSVILAQIVSLNGIVGQAYSTIGNTAYVAGYIIFNIFFTFILIAREQNIRLRWAYLALLPLLVKQFLLASSAGGAFGLGFSFFVMLFLYGMFSSNQKIKKYTFAAIITFSVLTITAFSNKSLMKDTSLLSDMSFEKNTFKTRLISWKAAMYDMPNHFFLGTGFGNFAVTFDKYFDPIFYNYSRSETYFDRAHNNIIEIASTTGMLGLMAYLSIFLAAGIYLIRYFNSGVINIYDFCFVSALLIAYFVQNLAVFDSLVTFIGLMMTLGYVHWITQNRGVVTQEIYSEENNGKVIVTRDNEIFALVVVGFVFITIIYQYNYKPIRMLKGTIDGQIAFIEGDYPRANKHYAQALSYHTGLDRDSKVAFVREVGSRISSLISLPKEERDSMVNMAIRLAEENVALNPLDSMLQLQLSQIYRVAADYYTNDHALALDLFNKSNDAIDRSIESSPRRIRIYFSKAQILLSAGKTEDAIEILKYASTLNEDYYDTFCHLGGIALSLNDKEEAYGAFDKCLALNGQGVLTTPSVVFELVKHYKEIGNMDNVIKLLIRLAELDPKNTSILIELAKQYASIGDVENAKKATFKATELNPNLRTQAMEFIENL
ncbi:O-antigen ligase family protein [Patescibacteria group bacterium]|nr:O-antigen ligase family protein [Patescibacteria group bacterium]